MGLKFFGAWFCLMVMLLTAAPGAAGENDSPPARVKDYQWALTLYNGVYTNRTLGKTTFNIPGKFERKYLHGLGLSRELTRFWDDFALELEGIFAKHHGRHKEGHQDYEEYVLAFLLRYDNFPWNHVLHTSAAIGDGMSLTSKTPEREVQIRGKSQRLLNYLAFELALTLPGYPKYSLVYRIHHRSGVFGLFGGVRGASDFYVLGLRYRF